MTFSAAVVGCTGYAGGEVLRLLLNHPQISVDGLFAGQSAGARLGEFHPNLLPLIDREVAPTTVSALADFDIVFMALPHGTAAALAAELPAATLIVDCSADHRLTDEQDWQRYYGGEYAPAWPYGLPELPGQRERLAHTKRIAVPGCYPTNVTLSLLPALLAGVIDGHDVTVAAASGSSGAGKALKPNLLGAELIGSMSAYGVGGGHRHTPEMLQNLRVLGAVAPTLSFTPMLAPMTRGILAVCTAPLTSDITPEAVRQIYRDAYATEPFAHVLADGVWPATKWVQGSNGFLVQVTVDPAVHRLVTVGVLDNLTKGTAGGAIQAMNLALGLDETTGLDSIGVAP